MAIIEKRIQPGEEAKPLDINGTMNLPAMFIPSFRICRARERNVEKNLLIVTQGGLGDVICAEPAIRWAIKTFPKENKISIGSDYPELFLHLDAHEIIDSSTNRLEHDNYLVFDTMYTSEVLHWEFLAHMFTHVVDHCCLVMWRSQIPMQEKCIQLIPSKEHVKKVLPLINPDRDVIIHPGKTWQSRTVPKWFWDKVTSQLKDMDLRPVIIGQDNFQDRGTVPIEIEGCLNLRNKLNLMETIALLQYARVLLTNDSAPIHMAASGEAHIGFVSTVKHPEHITHWRNGGEFGWRMKNFSRGGLWQTLNMCPNNPKNMVFTDVPEEQLNSWLPEPSEMTEWANECLRQSY